MAVPEVAASDPELDELFNGILGISVESDPVSRQRLQVWASIHGMQQQQQRPRYALANMPLLCDDGLVFLIAAMRESIDLIHTNFR